MTTKHSPFSVLKKQADTIAAMLAAFERGEPVNPQFAAGLVACRGKDSIKLGIAMDDKIITIAMPWTVIKGTSEAGMSEFILKQMRESRDVLH